MAVFLMEWTRIRYFSIKLSKDKQKRSKRLESHQSLALLIKMRHWGTRLIAELEASNSKNYNRSWQCLALSVRVVNMPALGRGWELVQCTRIECCVVNRKQSWKSFHMVPTQSTHSWSWGSQSGSIQRWPLVRWWAEAQPAPIQMIKVLNKYCGKPRKAQIWRFIVLTILSLEQDDWRRKEML